jgi:hypothetical protein
MTPQAVARAVLVVALGALSPPAAPQAQAPQGAAAITPGELVVDPPTLINLGFEWLVEGDANHNASVEVSYRKAGDAQWRQALPMLRLDGERIKSGRQIDVIVPNMFGGSILDLEPDTAYEAQFVMRDPDGVRGEARKVVPVRTRPEPKPAVDGRTFHVYPHGFAGAKQQPAFEGLMCAYNLTCSGTDFATAGRPRVRAGDTILVHAGVYAYNRYEYTNNPAVNSTQPLDGTYYLTADGTPERPIAIKAAGDGAVIFDGNGNYALFDVRAGDYHYFEGLTFRNAEYGILAGTQFLIGSKGLSVKRSRFEDVGAGIWTNYSGSSNFYIADNTFIGRDDPDRVIGWSGAMWQPFDGVDGQKFPPAMSSYVAVKLYGPGHVVAYNHVANFHDGIDIETYGNPDGSVADGGPFYPPRQMWHLRTVSIDFYNNVLTNFHDNPFEIDGSMHNIRVMRNVMLNSASHAFCNQPSMGGPTYWIRNIAYHLPGGSLRLTGGSAGILFYNNTILGEASGSSTSNVHFRNNLILGEQAAPAIFSISTLTNYSSSDYNGFRPNPGAPFSFAWNSPPAGTRADFATLTAAPADRERVALQARQFATLAEYARATGQDTHSVLVDYDMFVKVAPLNARDRATVQRVHKMEELDFHLRPGTAAVDKGTPLANVTDGFTGSAPDLGALEVNAAAPHYGPRP